MSNHLAVATVTATLAGLIQESAQAAVSGATVTVGRPTAPTSNTERKVHLYLYQVTPNGAFRGADLPTRNADGRLTTRPQAAIDLHYLVSFFGNNATFEPDRMLGAVVRDMHARPLLTRASIRDAIASHPVLGGSNLDGALESVKFTPIQISLDEMSKLWSVLVQIPHVLSVAYVGTVVLIDAEEGAAAALPVLSRGEGDRGVDTRVGPFPRLDGIWIGDARAAARQPPLPSLASAQLGLRLVIAGADLGADTLTLRFTHAPLSDAASAPPPPIDVTVAPADRTAQELRVDLPDDAAAQSAWAPGLYTVTATVVRSGATKPQTGALPFALGPHVTDVAPRPAVRDGAGDAKLTVTCRPRVLVGQRAVLVLADREIAAEPIGAATDKIDFVIRGAAPITGALVRLRVDGVDSLPFKFDPATNGFAFDDAQRATIQ